jgi:hypothetical protein
MNNQVDSHVFYRHIVAEVEVLRKAVEPFHDNILAVSRANERRQMKHVLGGDYFRRRDAIAMKNMLLRAAKHVRANLGDYFPVMRAQLLIDAQALEDAVVAYWANFSNLAHETVPTH